MKIIHTADLHLGSAFAFLPRVKSAMRKTELLDNFRKMAEYAKEQKVRAVLVAGDLFDGSVVDKQLLSEVFYRIECAKPVEFYYVLGNHDEYAGFMSAPNNLKLFPRGKGFSSYDLGEGIALTGANTTEFSEELFEKLALEEEKYNFLLLHGDIYHAQEKEGIALERIKDKGVDYLALGHIHKPMERAEKLDSRGIYRYAGCLEGRGFDECGKRGFFLLEVEDKKLVKEEFVSFSKRQVLQLFVDITGVESYFELEEKAQRALESHEKDVIKLIFTGKRSPLLKKDENLLLERLQERCFFVKIEDESRLELNLDGLENELSEAGEFIKEAGRYEMNADLREEVLEIGLKAIYGEEIDL